MASPVVLLHGIPVTSTIWRYIIDSLLEHGPVIAPDLLGYGTASHPDVRYGPEDYFQWLDGEVLAGVREPVTLVVHDFGGPVGLNWAVRRPDRVSRLVIMNTTVYPDATPWGFLVKVPGLIPLLFGLMMTKPLFGWHMRAMFRLSNEELIKEYKAVYTRPADRRTAMRAARAWGPVEMTNITAGFRQLACPVLLLWGLEDKYIFPWNPHGVRFLQDFPNAQVAHVPDAAHFLQAERPTEVLRHLKNFIGA
jgi:pimeloyl-ACP methyl ester carboxylesterase